MKCKLILFVFFSTNVFAQSININTLYEGNSTISFSSKKIVAIGESTHNSKEEMVLRKNLSIFLIEKFDFNTIFLEATEAAVEPINRFVQNSDTSDIAQLIFSNKLYWTWQTYEFIDFIQNLRLINSTRNNKIKVIGIDVNSNTNSRDSLMFENIRKKMRNDTSTKSILLAHNAHIISKSIYNFKSVGEYLKETYSTSYYSVGVTFTKGSFNSLLKSKNYAMVVTKTPQPVNINIANCFKMDNGISFTEVNKLPNTTIDRYFEIWNYGATIGKLNENRSANITLRNTFDAIVVIPVISPANNLRKSGAYFYEYKSSKKISVKDANAKIKLGIECSYHADQNGKHGEARIFLKLYDKKKLLFSNEFEKSPIVDPTFNTYTIETALSNTTNLVEFGFYLIGSGSLEVKKIEIDILDANKTIALVTLQPTQLYKILLKTDYQPNFYIKNTDESTIIYSTSTQ